MIASIMQPAYLPWLGYFHRISISDAHVVLDHVQIDKNSKTKFANRNRLRTKDGWCWLTVPLQTKGKFGSLNLNRLEIAQDALWASKHWAAIRHNYSRAPYFAEHAPFFEKVYDARWERLVDLTREITTYLLDAFKIRTPILYSSEMQAEGEKDALILNLSRAVGAKVYLSGPLGRDYLDEQSFQEAGIRVVYHDYHHPVYTQVYTGFEPYMSALDLLFNCGPESMEILMKNQETVAA